MCFIPIIFNDFEKDVERNFFHVNFLFNYYTELCLELLELFDQKKIVLNAFRVSTSLVVGTGTLVSTGVLLSLSESIWYNEQLQVAHLRRQKLLIPAEFQDQERE